MNKKLAQADEADIGGNKLRIWHRKEHGLWNPRYLIKCGCCDQSLKIYYDPKGTGIGGIDTLEINGVEASREEWRRILGPLLEESS